MMSFSKVALKIIRTFVDERGALCVLEVAKDIPFDIKRIFYMFGVSDKPRGGHAHRTVFQAMIAIHGSCKITASNGECVSSYILSEPNVTLIVPPGYWCDITEFRNDSILLVLASDLYDECEYIRDYDEFERYVREKKSKFL